MAGDGGVVWEAPGPGLWTHDPVHVPAPITGFNRLTPARGPADGFGAGYARYGHGGAGGRGAIIHGYPFRQPVLIGPELFDEREAAAREAIDQRLWRVDGERWFTVERPKMLQACRSFQAIDPASLDDAALAQHLLDALELQRRASFHHFSHIPMVFVVGEWLLAAERWGIGSQAAHSLLAGASPATAAAARDLARVADALHAAGVTEVESLDDVRRASAHSAAALDDYLATYGWRTVSGFDVDAKTLNEMPELLLTSIRNALVAPFVAQAPDPAPIRELVPEGDRAAFDDLLAEARYVYGIRDDDVAPCMWARGLIRRTLLEIGARLAASGAVHKRDHVFDAGADELVGLLKGASDPDADELAARAALRHEQALLEPPASIGTPLPPEHELPPTVARVTAAMAAYMGHPPDRAGDGITGTGVGERVYRGRACVARRVDDAAARLDVGDVLVTPITTPAFNSVLAIAGALVVEYGGPTSHSGIMARELDIPAVLDARGCMAAIPDGAEVEVDPVRGVVRLRT